ncbi:MAG: hypothetical protein NTW29_16205 [Bacteroidetes bacterium]|nr:hypothetical protein [Bacteroidota bacterium]
MQTSKKIVLCYRKIIAADAEKTWDRYVFESSFAEYRMQAQYYDPEEKYSSFSALVQQVPAAEKLHFLVSAAVTGYIGQLNNKVPDITDNLGRTCLLFDNYRFEIINSDSNNKKTHQVAVNFFTRPMIWHDTIGQLLLLSSSQEEKEGTEWDTIMVPVQPFLSIHTLKENT